jgi:hypothetical protein
VSKRTIPYKVIEARVAVIPGRLGRKPAENRA